MSKSSKPSLLLTGATGFLGSIFSQEFSPHFRLTSLGRRPENDQQIDLGVAPPTLPHEFDLIIHNAGKAHVVPKTAEEEADFFQINQQGTIHLLRGLEALPVKPKGMVLISTVAVYGKTSGSAITETNQLGGTTPYARSKLAAERSWRAWAEESGVPYLILRLPLVVGPHPLGNLGAMAKAIRQGYYFRIGHNRAQKSMVRGDDVANVINQWLEMNAKPSGIFNLTDDRDPTFFEIETAMATGLQAKIKWQLPYSLVNILAKSGTLLQSLYLPAPLNTDKLKKMTADLTFDCTLAKAQLAWQPRSALEVLADTKTWT